MGKSADGASKPVNEILGQNIRKHQGWFDGDDEQLSSVLQERNHAK